MKKLKQFIAFSLTITMLFGCGGGACPDLFLNEHDIIKEYHNKYFEKQEKTNIDDKFAIYLDYSSGMKIAFANSKTSDFYELFINSLKISNVDFYEVDKNEVTKIENLQKNELYKKIKNTEKFSGINAPLNKALTNITKENNEAVFITDGELWDNGERDDPWAREEFGNWLKKGNSIDFFVTDHLDESKEKHVFYMFFIPKEKQNNKNSIANNFIFYLDNSVEAKKLSYVHFSFSNSSFTLKQEYATEQSGGANENMILNQDSYINEGNTNNFEFQSFMLSWKDVMKYVFEAYDINADKIEGGDPIISKLFVETKDLEFYSIEELGIKVYDIKNDIEKLKKAKGASANPPTFVLNEKGEKLLDETNQPITDCPGQFGCYDEKGKLIVDTNFTASQNLKIVTELFDFDNEAFLNNFKEQGKGEIIIKIHKNFNGSQISSETENLHRVDVYLKKVTPETSNPNLSKFIWDGKQVDKNRSIYNSVLGALNEANPEGQIIYTYYIKTMPNDYISR